MWLSCQLFVCSWPAARQDKGSHATSDIIIRERWNSAAAAAAAAAQLVKALAAMTLCAICDAHSCDLQLKEASCGPPPPTSQEGQVLLTLDDGSVLRAHQLYLEHASPLFKASLPSATIKENPSSASCKRPRLASAEEPKLPLPGVTKRQAQLLVHALYSFMRETWASSL